MTINKKDFKPLLLGLSKTKHWLDEVSKSTKLESCLLPKKIFADGEILIEIPISVRNRDIFLCQTTALPANDAIMELLIAIDALNRASAKSISLIIPYFGYARQDRKAKGREPITAKLIANLLSFLKIQRILTFDLHSPQIQGFFDIPIDHISLLPQMLLFLLKKINFQKNQLKDFVLIAPDHGGYQRVKKISDFLNIEIAVMNKKRPDANKTEVNFVLGDVKNKNIIFLDDMMDTGNTIVNSINYLYDKYQVKKTYIISTHAVCSKDCLSKLDSLYKNKRLNGVLFSNSIPLEEKKKYSFIWEYSINNDLTNLIKILLEGNSIFEYGSNQLLKLSNYDQK